VCRGCPARRRRGSQQRERWCRTWAEDFLAGENSGAVLFEKGFDDVAALLVALGAHSAEDMRLVRSLAFGLKLGAGDTHLAVLVLLHDHALAAAQDRVEGPVQEKGHQPLG
jgi:hypothetical protein